MLNVIYRTFNQKKVKVTPSTLIWFIFCIKFNLVIKGLLKISLYFENRITLYFLSCYLLNSTSQSCKHFPIFALILIIATPYSFPQWMTVQSLTASSVTSITLLQLASRRFCLSSRSSDVS